MATERAQPRAPARGLAASLVFVAMLLAALSLWTAIPLSWIYIGSKVSDTQFPSGGPYAVVAVGIVVSILLDRLADRPPQRASTSASPAPTGWRRCGPTWLKSMRDTGRRPRHDDRGRGGADGLGAARRARSDRLVLPPRRLAPPEPVARSELQQSGRVTRLGDAVRGSCAPHGLSRYRSRDRIAPRAACASDDELAVFLHHHAVDFELAAEAEVADEVGVDGGLVDAARLRIAACRPPCGRCRRSSRRAGPRGCRGRSP